MGGAPRWLRSAFVWGIVLGCVCPACEPSPHDSRAVSTGADRATAEEDSDYRAIAGRAARAEASAEGVALHRRAAELAMGQFAQTGSLAQLERARDHLRRASRRRALDGACEASLALARLQARHAEDVSEAYLEAYRTLVRFGRDARHTVCVEDARFLLGVLDDHRPPPGVLAAIDADPDAHDPGVPAASGGASPRPPLAVLTALEVYAGADAQDEGRSARVVLRFDGSPVFRRGEVPAREGRARQVVFDFERVRIDDAASLPRSVRGGALQAVHLTTGEQGPRLAFDVAADASYRLFTLTEPHRLVLDVELPERAPGASSESPLVLLDPGHGGDDHGAVGHHGRTEAELALDISRRVRSHLARLAPGVRVRMTRESDVLLSLEERAAMANVLQADLFVSVHLNASSEPIERGGVATFVLDVNNDRNVLRLAARENQTPTSAVSELQFLVGSLARAEQARESREAARLIQRGALFGGRRFKPRLYDRGVRSAMFYVLVGAQMPAVLVEASFLTQQDEAELLARRDYRDALAEGIGQGVLQYLRSSGTVR